jgi:hypothetical protein
MLATESQFCPSFCFHHSAQNEEEKKVCKKDFILTFCVNKLKIQYGGGVDADKMVVMY